jgi:hypothetical protein
VSPHDDIPEDLFVAEKRATRRGLIPERFSGLLIDVVMELAQDATPEQRLLLYRLIQLLELHQLTYPSMSFVRRALNIESLAR